jgi:hypothetical protein
MPFLFRDLSVLSYANGFTLWHYKSATDTLAQISASGYFNSAGDLLMRNDLITVVGIDGARHQRVISATPGSVVVGHPVEEGRFYLQLAIPSLGAASESFVAAPTSGVVTAVRAVLEGATSAAVTLSPRVAGVLMVGSQISITPSPAGATFASVPTSGNSVAAGQALSVAQSGTAGTAARCGVLLEITRT